MTKTCSIDGCANESHAKGLCRYHYNRSPVLGCCSVEGCEKRVQAKGLCSMHYMRKRLGMTTDKEYERFIRENPPEDGVGLVPLGRARTHSGPLEVATVDADDYPRVIRHHWFPGHSKGGPVAKIGRRRVRLSHFILGVVPRKEVVYWDKNPLNNRRSNLAAATRSQVCANQRVSTRPKTSRFKGVCRVTNSSRFMANVHRGGKKYYLGCFDTEQEAALAYDEKARELFGPFARLNFPTG